jgi:hypothetical protein
MTNWLIKLTYLFSYIKAPVVKGKKLLPEKEGMTHSMWGVILFLKLLTQVSWTQNRVIIQLNHRFKGAKITE